MFRPDKVDGFNTTYIYVYQTQTLASMWCFRGFQVDNVNQIQIVTFNQSKMKRNGFNNKTM